MNAFNQQLARYIAKACELTLQLHVPHRNQSPIDDEFGLKLDLHLFSYYVNLLMLINSKREDKERTLTFYLYFYLQEKAG